MKTLFYVTRAHADPAFTLARRLHDEGGEVAFVFSGKGVHHTRHPETVEKIGFAETYTVASEFNPTGEEVEAIGYDRWVELLEESERTVSWV